MVADDSKKNCEQFRVVALAAQVKRHAKGSGLALPSNAGTHSVNGPVLQDGVRLLRERRARLREMEAKVHCVRRVARELREEAGGLVSTLQTLKGGATPLAMQLSITLQKFQSLEEVFQRIGSLTRADLASLSENTPKTRRSCLQKWNRNKLGRPNVHEVQLKVTEVRNRVETVRQQIRDGPKKTLKTLNKQYHTQYGAINKL
ncbi:uncharacterized protein Tco025E_00584 [Trypanosoma conorhini]|uniref:Uncharacterized protein n=1 Tax=Trypanosoma conorhini TaxID=83891 RepID=A0A422QB19_9TRYP|nr:uncharacterized protein Tco025E_00584 [Trypanosoma conorhini]RNF27147.1 hypothetical protein Tco025E_00584 [Trypanosoma conorhini]